MIRDNINYEYCTPSEFSSWSVSLLFVLMHDLRKGYALEENNILIYVMDTRNLPQSRIHYAPDLLDEYFQGWTLYQKTHVTLSDFAQGEYLLHGSRENTNGLWQTVELSSLLRAGFCEAFPRLWERMYDENIRSRLSKLRWNYFNPRHQIDVPAETLDIYLAIGRCFGEDWDGVIVRALITSHRRGPFRGESQGITCQAWVHEAAAAATAERTGGETIPVIDLRPMQRVQDASQFMWLLRILDDRERRRSSNDDDDISSSSDESMDSIVEDQFDPDLSEAERARLVGAFLDRVSPNSGNSLKSKADKSS